MIRYEIMIETEAIVLDQHLSMTRDVKRELPLSIIWGEVIMHVPMRPNIKVKALTKFV